MRKLKALSREAWEAEWKRTDPKIADSIGLMAFADLCNKVAAERFERWPEFRWDNRRYEVHLEDVLNKGGEVRPYDLDTITADDLQFDSYCFPRLKEALEARWLSLHGARQ